MTTLTVTATQGGSTGASLLLRVFVLTGAKPVVSQTGGSVHTSFATNTATWTLSITTTAGSNVYLAAAPSPAGQTPTVSNTTAVDTVDDATNGITYITEKAVNVTTGATTRGFTVGAAAGTLALQEILAQTTLAEDASAPAEVDGHGTSNLTVTTASFTPPAGSLLVAIVSSSGGAAVTTMTVTDNLGVHLNWTEKAKDNTSGLDYAGVWIADVPGGTPSPVVIQAVQPPQPPRPAPSQVILAPTTFRRVVTLSGVGTLAAGPGVGGFPVTTQAVAQPPQPAQPPAGKVIGLTVAAFLGAATLSGSGTLAASYVVGGVGSAIVRPVTQPAQPAQPPPGQITGSAPSITFTVGATLSGTGTLSAGPGIGSFPIVIRAVPPQPPQPPQPPPGQVLTGPLVFPGAATLSGSGTLSAGPGVGGLPLIIQAVTVPPQPAAPPPGRLIGLTPGAFLSGATLSGSGTLAAAPFFSAAAALSGTGTLAAAFTLAGTAPYVITGVTQPPQPPQPPAARLLGVPPPPPPPAFTIGLLTAGTAPGATLSAANTALGILTAATAASTAASGTAP